MMQDLKEFQIRSKAVIARMFRRRALKRSWRFDDWGREGYSLFNESKNTTRFI